MPPSYREFPKVTDGWRHAGGFVWLPAGTEQVRRHEDEMELAGIFEEYLDNGAGPEERVEADVWRRGLQLDVESDATSVLMDPEDVDENGEWAVYTWASWRGAPPERHANLRVFMRAMHREFHSLRDHRREEWRSGGARERHVPSRGGVGPGDGRGGTRLAGADRGRPDQRAGRTLGGPLPGGHAGPQRRLQTRPPSASPTAGSPTTGSRRTPRCRTAPMRSTAATPRRAGTGTAGASPRTR
ncbi:hypothetical protein SRO_1511 [Streptomyces rochei]|nr:hypothetical protein SRO_1511 [Streptomyces rochei]